MLKQINYVVCDGVQVLCTVIVITGLCDLVKTVVDLTDDSNDVPNYQIISPIVLLLSAVSVCVCVCVCVYCVHVRACVRVCVSCNYAYILKKLLAKRIQAVHVLVLKSVIMLGVLLESISHLHLLTWI